MPQEINLNVSPYFDDFDANKNYQKVLFKPSFPVQARELTGLQTILQNQIELLGNQTFKEGSVVIPGEITYNDQFFAIEVNPEFLGVPLENYINSLVGKTILGSSTNIKAKIIFVLDEREERNSYTLYINYLSSGNNGEKVFSNSETLLLNETVSANGFIIQESQGFANTIATNASSVGSCVTISDGIYYIRGNFINIYEQVLILDAHSTNPSFKVGFDVVEEIISSSEDKTLNDNAQGFNNFAAPGADRLKISAFLSKKELSSNKNESFIELFAIENGKIKNLNKNFNNIKTEIERKVNEISGDFYINPFSVEVKETLNNLKGNDGVFLENQITYNNNSPSEKLGTYKISPGKAIIKGSEVDIKNTTYVDFEKPRTTKTLLNQEISYSMGSSLVLNRSYGSPKVDLSNPFIVQLMDSRIGLTTNSPSGKEIGLARVYDYNLQSNSYNQSNNNLNQWKISLFDVQTYSEINLNEPLDTLNVPTRIEGKKSGAVGFLRYEVNQSGIITAYNVVGSFIEGEEILFDSISETRIITSIVNNNLSNVKSICGFDDSNLIFNADTKLTTNIFVGSVTISQESVGVSTVTSSNFIFENNVRLGDIVSYSSPSLNVPSFASVISVSKNNIVVSELTSVNGICNGNLPTSNLSVSDFRILTPELKSSDSDSLYTFLPKSNISNVNLQSSNLTIRKQYSVQITNSSTEIVESGIDLKFLPFSESRYILIRSNGIYEVLTSDKLAFSPDYKELQIFGLSAGNDSNARLIATLSKENVKNVIKNKEKVNSLIIDKSNNRFSGIGSTTINDGLEYGNYPYGTRVQDKEICLLRPEITKIYGIFESYTNSDPELPSLILSEISTTQSTTAELLLGEEIIGNDSGAIAILAEKINDNEIGIVYLNSNKFKQSETILFKDTKATSLISSIKIGSKNITDHYNFDLGSNKSIFDFSKLVRKSNYKNPTKKIKIIYETASVSVSEIGDIVSVNSYNQFDYCEIPFVEGKRRCSDILDIRPRVSKLELIKQNTRSPFEFLGRSFTSEFNVLASSEPIRLSYSYYLPRIDRIFLNNDGNIFVVNGIPSDNPNLPSSINDSLEIANVYLSPYLCNIKDVSITLLEHKRYRMKDIHTIENRVKNLEYYTTLSLLESKVESMKILDSNGNERFKTGFFVDDFTDISRQLNPQKNSIDAKEGELRPSYNSAEIDLILGSKSTLGIGTTSNSSVDFKFADDLIGNGVKRTGQILTLDYEDEVKIEQPFATRYENLNSKLIRSYVGSIEIYPSSDIWFDNNNNSNIWNSWELNWTGVDISSNEWEIEEDITEQYTRRKNRISHFSDSIFEEDYYIDIDYSYKLRKRNIEFIGKGFKPFTQVYAFFDGIDVNNFIIPKLIEISMLSGSFISGETVVGKINNTEVRFRLSASNHKFGPITNPIEIYTTNPYNRNINVPSDYTSTSTLLNLDTYSISYHPQGNFYGNIESGMILRGVQSNAQARITDIKLITDENGFISGSLYIPENTLDVNPSFDIGLKTLKLTSNQNNPSEFALTDTFAEKTYFSGGRIKISNERLTSVRSPIIETNKNLSSIAQSFIVAEETGFFVTKLDLFLKSKDDILPLVVQLRTMSMGLPTNEIIPFSEIFLNPNEIKISEDGSIATEVKFQSPIYLNPNIEFAIVLFSQSDEYSIWTSRLGEVDITTLSGSESQQIISTSSANVGSLYKTYNINQWSNISYESLKFNLYAANFTSTNGNINFFNPDLTRGSGTLVNLNGDSLEFNSRKIIVGLGTTLQENQIQLGNTITQELNSSFGNYVGLGGSSFGNLSIVNAGIGYTPFVGSFTYNNVKLSTLTGNGRDAKANVTIQNGVAIAATISEGGLGYTIGDTLTIKAGEIGISSLGRNIILSVSEISGVNQIILDNVIGDFEVSQNKQLSYVDSNDQEVLLNLGGVYITSINTFNQFTDGLHIKVNHDNHGMHSSENSVLINGVSSDLSPVRLENDYPFNISSDIILSSTENFEVFEGQPVSPNNPGYILINGEIISYYGVVGNTLTNIERGIDQTNVYSHFSGDLVQKYEISGISLRRVNKIHDLDYTINSIDLDSYYIKIDMGSSDKGTILDNGPYGQVDRSVGNVYPKLYINESKSSGGSNIYASQNIQYETIKPIIQTLMLPGTNISSSLKTTTGTSISGNEESYIDSDFIEINLNSNNYYNYPQLVASKINEERRFNGNKSLTLNINLSTTNKNISPVIDLDRVGAILVSNRVDYNDLGDKNAFEYITKTIRLKNPATGIKVIMESYINVFNEINVYYSTSNDGNNQIYLPFPGYDNLDDNGNIIKISDNSGLSDEFILKSDVIFDQKLDYKNYTFTAENLSLFKYFSIKVVGKSKNQSCPPRVRDFRVIALA